MYARPIRETSGCSIPVVCALRVREDRVRFPASRQTNSLTGRAGINYLEIKKDELLAYKKRAE